MKRRVTNVVFLIVCMGRILLGTSGDALAETEVRIAGFGGSFDQQAVEGVLTNFVNPVLEKEGITVTYEPIPGTYQQQLLNSLSAGTGPDLFYMDIYWAQNVIDTGAIEPLDEYIAQSTILQQEDIIPALIDGFTVDGKVYGIPKDFNSLALFYNKDLFDLAEVEYPTNDETWDSLEDKLKKVVEAGKAEGKEVYGLATQAEYARMGAFAFAGGWKPIVDNKTDLFDPAFKEAFEWYTGLKEKGVGVVPADIGQGWGGGAFAGGNVAACLEGAWLLGFLRDQAPNLEFGATLLPKSPKTGQRGNFVFTVSWSINKDSKVKDAAFKVLELLTGIEAQQWVLERGLAIPSRQALADNPYFQQDTKEAQANKVVFQGASDGNIVPYFLEKYGADWVEAVDTALNEVFSEQTTVDEALKTAQNRLDVDVMK